MKYAVITDAHVAPLYGEELVRVLRANRYTSDLFVVPAGESSKSLDAFQKLCSQMYAQGCGRDTTVIALGGGMITDLAGFVASTFCRGVPVIYMPTTLLAMVDAAIGGKTAVNLPEGKNLIGSYYFPQKVLLHFPFLKTLPDEEWENGFVEILKMGLIADPDLFYGFSKLSIETLVFRAIERKRRIVAQDPYDQGRRSLLNLGHTIGHALEALSDYTLSHGKAVGIGIVIEARLSHKMGILSAHDLHHIEATFPSTEFVTTPDALIRQLKVDKKARHGTPYFVLLEKIGKPYIKDGCFCHPVPETLLRQVLYDPSLCSC
jgi:3-dehydroquinate synthase